MSLDNRMIMDLLAEDALAPALDEARAAVKTKPADKALRHLYIDLLVLSGDYERADAQCDVAARFEATDGLGYALLRREIRAMAARADWYDKGAMPSFPGGPGPLDEIALKLGLAVREQSHGEAASLVRQLDEARGERPMNWNGAAISDLRDLDDRLPHALEVLTNGGAYLWVDIARIESLVLQPIARARDLAFRRAELTLAGGASASVLLPAIYPGIYEDSALALGRQTEWVELAEGLTIGRGQRSLFNGDDMVSLHELESLEAVQDKAERQAARG
ncbi:type VI secretion system accessory protein TagJ [Rhizobium paknamense]|uniref:Type VI secretion system protein ImpE n=1 Tax=Rhizobium paknamense TaxID=1206817 RepID=A0ABU0I8M8_9HYPH|nr:type VI secretion system accessory protein TagJ [Rhizobium paknamense]MDQ0454592.1 type VI secretion system protein ImpE [Rhizobium paknamense]